MRELLAAEPALAATLIDPPPPVLLAPLVAGSLSPEQAEGLDLIFEGFLLHHGRARHLAAPAHGAGLLAGDYCYATGLVRVAAAGDLAVIRALADLIASGAALAAADRRALLPVLWRGTVGAIARRDEPAAIAAHRTAIADLRVGRDSAAAAALTALGAALPALPALEDALSLPDPRPEDQP